MPLRIPDEVCEEVIAMLLDIARFGKDRDGVGVRHRAAESLGKMCLTQDKYLPSRVDELAKLPKASQNVRDLAALTQDELLKLQAEMVAAEWKED